MKSSRGPASVTMANAHRVEQRAKSFTGAKGNAPTVQHQQKFVSCAGTCARPRRSHRGMETNMINPPPLGHAAPPHRAPEFVFVARIPTLPSPAWTGNSLISTIIPRPRPCANRFLYASLSSPWAFKRPALNHPTTRRTWIFLLALFAILLGVAHAHRNIHKKQNFLPAFLKRQARCCQSRCSPATPGLWPWCRAEPPSKARATSTPPSVPIAMDRGGYKSATTSAPFSGHPCGRIRRLCKEEVIRGGTVFFPGRENLLGVNGSAGREGRLGQELPPSPYCRKPRT